MNYPQQARTNFFPVSCPFFSSPFARPNMEGKNRGRPERHTYLANDSYLYVPRM
jgi:hypothetical protein